VAEKSLALVFAGYGAQHQGMLRDLRELSDVRIELARLLDAAEALSGLQLAHIAESGPGPMLAELRVAFPLLFIADYLWARFAREAGLRPQVMAGHDVGEYAALVHAGVISATAGLDLVVRLSKLLEESIHESDGVTLVVLGLSLETVNALLNKDTPSGTAQVWVSCDNNADQVILGGLRSELEALVPRLLGAGARQTVLAPRIVALNTPLVTGAADQYRLLLDQTEFRDAKIPVIMNATAQAATKGSEFSDLLAAQVTSSLRWRETINRIARMAPVVMVESGPGSTLSDLNDTDDGIEYYSLAQSGIIKLLNRL